MLAREAPLRRRIAELEAQVQKLDLANLAQQATYNEASRTLRMHIVANTSEAMAELQGRAEQLQAERDIARRQLEHLQKQWDRVSGSILGHLTECLGGNAGMAKLIDWCGGPPDSFLLLDEERIAHRKLGAVGVAAIRRARRGNQGFTTGVPR